MTDQPPITPITPITPVIDMLAVMDRHSGLLPLPAPRLRTSLNAVRRAYERSHLAVVGPEGAGKSTLINALVGAEVAPTSAYLPGTVAPVHVVYGDHPAPRFKVVHVHEVAGPTTIDTDRQDFERWMLQDHNRGNCRRVLRGEISLRADLLRDGLRLVDLPGANSVSPEVSAQTAEDLEGSAFTAVLVNLGRVSIAAVTDVLRQLAQSPYDVKVAAVVFNEADARLLTPERLTDHLTMRRRSVTECLLPADQDDALGVGAAGTYTLHLPSLLRPPHHGDRGPGTEQSAQWTAFRTEVAEQVRRNVSVTAVAAARQALPLLDGALADRVRLIDGVLGHTVTTETAETVRREVAESTRDLLYEAESSLRNEDWLAFEPSMLRVADRLRRGFDTIEGRLSTRWTLAKAEAAAVESEIQQLLAEAQDSLAAAVAPSFAQLAARLEQIAGEGVAAFDARIPVGATETSGTAEDTGTLRVGSYEYTSLGDVWDELANDGKMGLAVALLPTTWGILAGFHYLGGGHLGYTRRRMRGTRKEIDRNLAPASVNGHSPVWLEIRLDMVAKASDEASRRLAGSAAEATGVRPRSTDNLTRHRQAVEAARKELAAWQGRLDASVTPQRRG